MSIDPRRTQPFCAPRCFRKCRCSRWPDYKNRFGWPVRPGATYDDDVLATGPIAYWPQSETAGLTAHCLVNPLQDGTYTGVTLANDNTGPFGTPAPFYDGANDYCNIFSAALVAAFDGAEGSAMIWSRVVNVGAWTDGVNRERLRLRANVNNFVRLWKAGANNQNSWQYIAGGVAESRITVPITDTAWMCQIITWSASADEVRYYRDAAWLETDVGLGVWAGALAATLTCIGAQSTVPAGVWHGWLGPCAIWDRALTQAEVTALDL